MLKKPFRYMPLLAVLTSAATPALAQSSVKLYGVIDGGIGFNNNGVSKVTGIDSGYASASRYGFEGTENLGGGYSAIFKLEAGFSSDTGASKSYVADPATATAASPGGVSVAGGFNRQSHVGLTGPFGTLLLGRDYTPLFWAGVMTDPMRFGMYGNLQGSGVLSGTGIERYGRVSNAVFYTTPTVSGFKGRLNYSLGSESSGATGQAPKGANEFTAVGLEYNGGALTVSAAYQQLKLPLVSGGVFTGNGTRKDSVIGGNYQMGAFTLSGGYLKVSQPVAKSDGQDMWLGGSYTSGVHKVMGLVQKLRQQSTLGDKDGTSYGFGYSYALSKRSELYGTFGYVKNGANASFPLLSADTTLAPGAVGVNPRGLAFGIRHSF